MPIFFLHLRDGPEFVEDLEGSEFAGLREAKLEAIAAAREILAERIKLGQHLDGQRIEICDSYGSQVGSVAFRSVFTLDPDDEAPGMTTAEASRRPGQDGADSPCHDTTEPTLTECDDVRGDKTDDLM